MSHSTSQNQRIKIGAITGMRTDVIFLSDTRLGNRNLTSAKSEISNLFLVNSNRSYKLYTNSTKNSRGVGILIAADLNFTIESTILDPGENYILLRASVCNEILILGSTVFMVQMIMIEYFFKTCSEI
jgi:hypothetical protein